jgi:hypothetical protein
MPLFYAPSGQVRVKFQQSSAKIWILGDIGTAQGQMWRRAKITAGVTKDGVSLRYFETLNSEKEEERLKITQSFDKAGVGD